MENERLQSRHNSPVKFTCSKDTHGDEESFVAEMPYSPIDNMRRLVPLVGVVPSEEPERSFMECFHLHNWGNDAGRPKEQ